MDTKLKKFDKLFIKKAVAFLLCLVSVGTVFFNGVRFVDKIEEKDLDTSHFVDAVLDSEDNWEKDSFKQTYRSFLSRLAEIPSAYGDGSEEFYNNQKKSVNDLALQVFNKAKQNLITSLDSGHFEDYIAACWKGIISSSGIIYELKQADTSNWIEDSVIDIDLGYLCNGEFTSSEYKKIALPNEVAQAINQSGADGAVYTPGEYYITMLDDTEPSEEYLPGYYDYTVNDDVLLNALIEGGFIAFYGSESYETFKNDYDNAIKTFKEHYESAVYYLKDTDGNVYTNVKGIKENAGTGELKKVFSEYDRFIYQQNGNLYTDEGKRFDSLPTIDHFFTDSEYYNFGFYSVDSSYPQVTLTMPSTVPESTISDTTAHTTVVDGNQLSTTTVTTQITDEGISAPVEATTMRVAVATTQAESLEVEQYFFALDQDIQSETCLFANIANKIIIANNLFKQAVFYFGISGIVFLICFIYLLTKSGRKNGSNEVHFAVTDKIFTDWKIAINCLICFGVFLLGVFWLEEAWHRIPINNVAFVTAMLAMVFAGVALDLILFITKNLKNKSLLKNLFIVWIIRKAVCKYKEKVKPFIDEKMLYTKNFERNTAIIFAGVVLVNLIAIFFGIIEIMNGSAFIALLLGIFDIFVLIQLIRFIAGVKQIFSAIDRLKAGEMDITFNHKALPPSLHETADKLMTVRDGLQTAVNEAVKQERTKAELITNVSHDLKTPLTSVINYVELLKKCDIDDETAKEYLSVLGEKSDRLKKLIEDLVEASKASTGNVKLNLVTVSLNEILNQIAGEFADEFSAKGLILVTDFPEENITIHSDSKVLYRILENIMGNTAKYAMENTRVYLTLKKQNGQKIISLKNISASPLNISASELMERFVRGDQARTNSGNGLGLSIAQSLCTVLGGELKIEINGDLFVAQVEF